MSESKTTTTIRMDDEILSKIRDIATKEKRSVNQQIEYAVEFFLKEYERLHGAVKL